MRKKLHEIMGVPPEDQSRGTPEYPVLPDEFNRFTPPVEEEEQKPSRLHKALLLLAAAGLTTVGVFWHINARPLNPAEAEATPTAPQQTAVLPSGASTIETPQVTVTPSPTPTPTPEPTPIVLDGKIHIVVYADSFDLDLAMAGDYPSGTLLDETVDAAGFTGYPLPELPTQEGYTAYGYVLLLNSSEEYFSSIYFDGEQPRTIGSIPVSDVLTLEDVAHIPQNDEGVREAEIHVVWLEDTGSFVLEFYDGSLFGKYPVGFPLYSEGMVYLAAFPTPEREGFRFVGWRDGNGNIIDAVTFFDFYEPLPGAETLEDRDWSKKIPCALYAVWTDPYGATPEPTPEPLPDCQVIYYRTFSVTNAVVMLTDRKHTTSVHVRLYDALVDDSALDYDFTADDISFGMWSETAIDLNDFYGKHMEEYEALGEYGNPPLEVTLTYQLDDGTVGTVVRSADPQPEEYPFVDYHDTDQEADDYTFPGCFVAAVYGTENPDLMLSPDPYHRLNPGEITVTIMINGEAMPENLCHVERIDESFEYEGVQYTQYTYFLVMPRPNYFPAHGKATVQVRQKLLHYNYEMEHLYEIEY